MAENKRAYFIKNRTSFSGTCTIFILERFQVRERFIQPDGWSENIYFVRDRERPRDTRINCIFRILVVRPFIKRSAVGTIGVRQGFVQEYSCG